MVNNACMLSAEYCPTVLFTAIVCRSSLSFCAFSNAYNSTSSMFSGHITILLYRSLPGKAVWTKVFNHLLLQLSVQKTPAHLYRLHLLR